MNIGVVAIGRNEGQRLRACLTSARRDCPAVVYVDSGSTDGSVELAKSLGVHVVELDLQRPFTAARARNEGFAKLHEIEPALEAVQFVDGDCEIVAGWIGRASEELSAKPDAAVVCGRRRERFPEMSFYNRLCDMEWDTPIGPAQACGGDAMIRVTAFVQVGGYDPAVIAGEEPEMCVRLRAAGWTIHRIAPEMTLHDAAITRFGQWWKRNVRSGHAYAEGNFLHGAPPEHFRQRDVQNIQRWVIFPVCLSVISVAVIGIAAVIGIVAPSWLVLGLLPLMMYPVLAIKIAKQRMDRGATLTDSLLYGSFVALGKFPQWIGICRFRSNQQRGEPSVIIEYKD